jgi:hypothetical protein
VHLAEQDASPCFELALAELGGNRARIANYMAPEDWH